MKEAIQWKNLYDSNLLELIKIANTYFQCMHSVVSYDRTQITTVVHTRIDTDESNAFARPNRSQRLLKRPAV